MKPAVPARCVPRAAMRLYRLGAVLLRRNHLVFRLMFGFRPPPTARGELWDWTTLLLRRAFREVLTPGASFLDMGTGPVAVLAIYARRKLRCGRVCAVDHVPTVVEDALGAANYAHAAIEVIQASLFSDVRGNFDLIGFNAPYIDGTSGSRLSLFDSEVERRRLCGGRDGMETIGRFLSAAGAFLTSDGRVLLGVNRFYVLDSAVRAVAGQNGYLVERTWGNAATRSAVYLMAPLTGLAARNGLSSEH